MQCAQGRTHMSLQHNKIIKYLSSNDVWTLVSMNMVDATPSSKHHVMIGSFK